MTRSVYVAAASRDIERAEAWIAMLRGTGITVTSSWPENVRRVGAANPREASVADRRGWSTGCIEEVEDAGILWLLVGARASWGAGWEAGYAHARGKIIVASGTTWDSIFFAHGAEFATDQLAFEYVSRVARGGVVERQRSITW